MLLKTILNHRSPLKGFVYVKCQIVGNRSNGKDEIHVQLKPRKNSRPRCGSCGKPGAIYDTRKERRFQFVPILGLQVFFLYAMRRVNCVACGVKTERLGWSSGKERMTTAINKHLTTWDGDVEAFLDRIAAAGVPLGVVFSPKQMTASQLEGLNEAIVETYRLATLALDALPMTLKRVCGSEGLATALRHPATYYLKSLRRRLRHL